MGRRDVSQKRSRLGETFDAAHVYRSNTLSNEAGGRVGGLCSSDY